MVSIIIPAHNEMERIQAVITPALSHPWVQEVIVIDDGSTDDTAAVAKHAGATVIQLKENKGKAFAMEVGVRNAISPYICFLDADIIGLTPDLLTQILAPVVAGTYDMYVAIRGRKMYWLNRILRFFPVLGGERAMTREVWGSVPTTYKNHFQIEIALNYYTKKMGKRMGFHVVSQLSQIIKEKKWGFWYGMFRRFGMMKDVCVISCKLYIVESLLSHIKSFSAMLQPSKARSSRSK